MENNDSVITALQKETLSRLPGYLKYFEGLQSAKKSEAEKCDLMIHFNLTSDELCNDFKSIGFIESKDNTYNVNEVLSSIKKLLGYNNVHDAVLVGAGHLGQTLLSYEGFSEFGLNIVAGFDINMDLIGEVVHNKQILSIEKLSDICSRLYISMGIVTVTSRSAQRVCDLLVKCGIKAIWNFTSVSLNVPDDVIVQNENLAESFASLSNRLASKLK